MGKDKKVTKDKKDKSDKKDKKAEKAEIKRKEQEKKEAERKEAERKEQERIEAEKKAAAAKQKKSKKSSSSSSSDSSSSDSSSTSSSSSGSSSSSSSSDSSSSDSSSSDSSSSDAKPAAAQGLKRKAEEEAESSVPQKTQRIENPELARGITGTEVFIAQVSDGVTDEIMSELLVKCGVEADSFSIRWGTDRETGAFKGFGFATFKSSDDVQAILNYQGDTTLCGKRIAFREVAPREGGFQTPQRGERSPGGFQSNNNCFNCKEAGHQSRDCPQPRVMTCFKCNKEGHMSRECPEAGGGGGYGGGRGGGGRGGGRGRF
jgi:RNA recognition motif-containing protein